jgi:hypothetical protein
MLEYLDIKNVGPAPEMKMELARRLNLITGDNGLGKSFLLDIAWWALTRTWAGYPARPDPGTKAKSTIGFAFEGKAKRRVYESSFDLKSQWSSMLRWMAASRCGIRRATTGGALAGLTYRIDRPRMCSTLAKSGTASRVRALRFATG